MWLRRDGFCFYQHQNFQKNKRCPKYTNATSIDKIDALTMYQRKSFCIHFIALLCTTLISSGPKSTESSLSLDSLEFPPFTLSPASTNTSFQLPHSNSFSNFNFLPCNTSERRCAHSRSSPGEPGNPTSNGYQLQSQRCS
jgi:hypothetical protein